MTSGTQKRPRAKKDDDEDDHDKDKDKDDKETKMKTVAMNINMSKLQLTQHVNYIGEIKDMALARSQEDVNIDTLLQSTTVENLDRISALGANTNKEQFKMAVICKAFYEADMVKIEMAKDQLNHASSIYTDIAKTIILTNAAAENGRVSWEAIANKAKKTRDGKLITSGKVIFEAVPIGLINREGNT